MKSIQSLLTAFVIMLSVLLCGGKTLPVSSSKFPSKIDQLNPKFYSESLKLKNVLDEIASKKWDYDIKIEKTDRTGDPYPKPAKSYYYYWNKYHVTLPDAFKKLNRCPRYEFYKYINNPKYSFYICLYLLSKQEPHPEASADKFLPLVNKDKKKWDSNIKYYTKVFIQPQEQHPHQPSLDRQYYYLFPRTQFMTLLPADYQGLFNISRLKQISQYRSADATRLTWEHVISQNGKLVWDRNSKSFKDYEKYKIFESLGMFKKFKKFNNCIEDYQKNKDNVDFSQIPPTVDNILNWLQFVLNVDAKGTVINLEAFLAYLRSQKELKPLYPVCIMTLFIVKGYTFDPKTGNYALNEAGELMLDYIVENPVEDNVERLKIIMDGGNAQLIKDFMKKYNTTEKWNKYLK